MAPIAALSPDPLHNIALIIFDCDGVLIDSEPIASATLACSMREMGVAISDRQSHEAFTGNAVSVIRRMIQDKHPALNVDGLFARWDELLYAGFREDLVAMPGMADVVQAISRPKCVASNSSMRRLEGSLGRLDLWSCFHPNIFSAEAVPLPKPAPDLLLHCACRFQVDPALCVMVDDSPHGIEAARSAGMASIGFVDPADPRPKRGERLRAAGAVAIATGAEELPAALRVAARSLSALQATPIITGAL